MQIWKVTYWDCGVCEINTNGSLGEIANGSPHIYPPGTPPINQWNIISIELVPRH